MPMYGISATNGSDLADDGRGVCDELAKLIARCFGTNSHNFPHNFRNPV